jgi:arylsulfatase A-like enzyme
MNAICLVVDRLHVGQIGAYGNTWIETPSLDRLACESIVFDQCLVSSPTPGSFCRSCWHGTHPLSEPESDETRPSLPSLLGGAGVATTLLTDEPLVARHPLSEAFESLVEVERPREARTADQIEETHLAQCFARIVEWLQSAEEPFLLWCHLSSLGSVWDAPWEFRSRYAVGEDPDPPESAEVPSRALEDDYDPDELLGISHAYAGQVSLLDACVGALLEVLGGSPAGDDTLLALLSPRGFPLGEHRRVGACGGSLYAELVHVPLLVRFPDLLGQAVRTQALVQPADLYPTLVDWWGIGDPAMAPAAATLMPLVREEVDSIRDRLCIAGPDAQRAVRTPAWYLRDAAGAELFLKPDDRWEVNDVSDRCWQVVDLLRRALLKYEASLRRGRLRNLEPLEEILLTGPQ